MVTRRHLRGLLSGMLVSVALPAAATCDRWDPLAQSKHQGDEIDAQALIELIGIGRADTEPVGGPSPLAVSPDQRRLAFIVQRAALETNDYCQALIMIDLGDPSSTRVLDRGGEFIVSTVAMRGTVIPTGFPAQIIPQWSLDGSTIGFLRRDHGMTQLWIADLDKGASRQLTDEKGDIVDWRWVEQGRIEVTIESDNEQKANAIEIEGRSGWVYDSRFTPNSGLRPQRSPSSSVMRKIVDVHGGGATSVVGERKPDETHDDVESEDTVRLSNSITAELIPTSTSPLAPRQLKVADGDTMRHCAAHICTGRFDGLWRMGRTVVFLKREGWNGRYSSLYRWHADRAPERIVQTDDWLERCTKAAEKLLCIRESAMHPPHIVAVNVQSGAVRTLFDPNRGIADRLRTSVRRLTWRNANGLEVYGDLVLPPDYHMADRLPAIITLYQSRGFLRGGTGNEYPIHLFAQRGYAVLSVQRPELFAAHDAGLRTVDEVYAANVKDWSDRRSVHSAIEAGVALLVSKGVADQDRIGLTGLSDGAAAARFALVNSETFAAAALSTCCIDETSAILAGPAWEQYTRSVGYPKAFPTDEMFWRPGSLVLNASAISTPLLMQLADYETLLALPSFAALRQYGQPVELRIFPDEFHIKRKPAHRAAIYQTNLEWFDFWLNGDADAAIDKADQYARWRALRAQLRDKEGTQSSQERIQDSTSANRITRP